jgi:phosphonate transport system substrate-binding protein
METSRLRRLLSVYLPLAAFLLLISGSGCTRREEPLAPKPAAEQGGGGKKLLIGLVPEQSVFKQMERYEPLARYLTRKTGIEIQLVILPRYGNIISNFKSAKMDGAFFGSFTYALAHEKLGVDVLARPEALDGTSTYHGMIFVRKDSGIVSVEQMQGKRFVFVDKATTAGYLLPLAYFQKHRKDFRTFLREYYFSGTHEDAIYDVLNKKADIGAAKNTVFDRLARSDKRLIEELLLLAQSPEVPENALAVRKGLESALTSRIQSALLAMDRDAEGAAVLEAFGARRFILTRNSDYRPVHDYARDNKLDLATYDYLSD